MRRCSQRDRRNTRRNGLAMVEFAMILPMLMTITLACVDFGRIGYLRVLLTNAAEYAAGVGASRWSESGDRSAWESDVQAAVEEELSQLPNYDSDQLEMSIAVGEQSETLRIVSKPNSSNDIVTTKRGYE